MKTVWLIMQHSMPPELGHYNRHYYFAKYLKRDGYQPVVFAGSKLHNSTIQMISGKKSYTLYNKSEFPFIFVKTCDYHDNKLLRLWAMIQFHWKMLFIGKHFPRPDVVLGSSSYPLSPFIAIILSKIYRCKNIVEIRDLWPESIVTYLHLSPRNPLVLILYKFEKWIYNHADEIVFTIKGGKDYIIDKKWDIAHGGKINLEKVHHINNGVDLEDFYYNKSHFQLDDDDLKNLALFKVIYVGSLRMVNHMETILEAAKQIVTPQIKFLIWGEGNEKEHLIARCKQESIQNISFKGHISKKYIPYILSQADVCLLHWSQSELMKYGCSPNKLFDYAASGKKILSDITTSDNLIEKYHCGIVLPTQDPKKIACAVEKLYWSGKCQGEDQTPSNFAKDYSYRELTRSLELIL